MAPDSRAVELLAVAAAIVAAVLLALTWDAARGRRRIPVRAATVALCLLTLAAAAGIWVNRQVETYTSWSALFATGDSTGGTPETYAPDGDAGGAGQGRIVTVTVHGRASGLVLPMYVYLPAAYAGEPAARFPVVEALHGYPGSPVSWLHRLAVASHLNSEISAGRMAPTIVLFPYQTPNPLLDTECTDLAGGVRAETFLTVDVPAAAAAHFRIRTDRGGWGLIGYSAGGFCATNLLLRHPTQYAAAASLSGYADPGIAVGDGSEHTTNNDAWRLAHLPIPAAALYLACARTDRSAFRGTRTLAWLARPPLSVTTAYLSGGGHNDQTWQTMEAPAFDWLSSWLDRATT